MYDCWNVGGGGGQIRRRKGDKKKSNEIVEDNIKVPMGQ
jgi:hypothetical protein